MPEEKIYFFTLKCQERLIFTDLEYLVTEIDVLMRLDLLLYPFIRFFQAYFKISFNHFSIKIPFVYFFVIKIYTYIFTNTTELNRQSEKQFNLLKKVIDTIKILINGHNVNN